MIHLLGIGEGRDVPQRPDVWEFLKSNTLLTACTLRERELLLFDIDTVVLPALRRIGVIAEDEVDLDHEAHS